MNLISWMKKERGLLYLAVDEEGKAGAMFFVILPGAHPDNLGYDLGNGGRETEALCYDGYGGCITRVSRALFTI